MLGLLAFFWVYFMLGVVRLLCLIFVLCVFVLFLVFVLFTSVCDSSVFGIL